MTCVIAAHAAYKELHALSGWVKSFATLPTLDTDTATRMWVITIYCHPGCKAAIISSMYLVVASRHVEGAQIEAA